MIYYKFSHILKKIIFISRKARKDARYLNYRIIRVHPCSSVANIIFFIVNQSVLIGGNKRFANFMNNPD